MRPKTCKECGIKFIPERSFQKCCSIPCAIDYGRKESEKQKNALERITIAAERTIYLKAKERIKTKGEWLSEAQSAFNAFIRERDRIAGYPCISSGRPLDWSGNAVDAGHYRSRGSAPHLRFDERNVHAQSKHDNRYLAGNVAEYRIGLIKRYGLEYVEALEADNEPKKYTIEDLKAIKAEYKAKLKQLKLNNQ